MESKSKEDYLGVEVAEMRLSKDGKFSTLWCVPSTGTLFSVNSEFRKDSVLITGDLSKWHKLKSYSQPILPSLHTYQSEVEGRLLDEENYLITIPDFSESRSKIVDSIVLAEYGKIRSTKNLIIDIRNNVGGTVRRYEALFPLVYTDPIIRIGGYTKCSDKLIVHKEEVLKELQSADKEDSLLINAARKDLEIVKRNRGKVLLETGDTLTLDSVCLRPANVAIVTNYACQSAAEMMLLDFKQSRKVTVFGEHTMGTVDYLNMYPVEFPSKKYILYFPTVKRYIPPGQTELDNKGIYPDVSIPDKEQDWIDYVMKYYSSKS